MKTWERFGWSLACIALSMAVLISCAATGSSEDSELPPDSGGGDKVLVPLAGELIPAFNPAVLTGYELEVPSGTGTTGIAFTYGGAPVPPTSVSGSVSEDANPFTVTLLVKGAQKTYEINVIVLPSADIAEITLGASDFGPLVINNPESDISRTAPYSDDPQPAISVTLSFAGASAAAVYAGDFDAFSGTGGTIAVEKGEIKSGSITIRSAKTIAEKERVVTREYTLSLSRPNKQALAQGGLVSFIDVGEGKFDEVHLFTDSDTLTFSVPSSITNASLLVVAGGGGGGSGLGQETRRGGGGGAGGLVYYDKSWTLDQQNYQITVGAGGTKGTAAINPTNGGDSSFGSTVVAKGGGKGSSHNTDYAGAGGSGGGGSNSSTKTGGAAIPATLPAGDSAQSFGYAGGSLPSAKNYSAAGGGGAGGPGGNVSATSSGSVGGAGKKINIEKGGEKWYAAGGSAGNITASSGGGCPNPAGATDAADAVAGAPHSGNGGGGGYSVSGNYAARVAGADGGSGIVVIRFPYDY